MVGGEVFIIIVEIIIQDRHFCPISDSYYFALPAHFQLLLQQIYGRAVEHCWHWLTLARSLISGVEMVLEEPLAWLNTKWEHDQWAKQQYCSSSIFFFFLYTSHDRSQFVRVNIHQAAFHVRHQQLLLFGGVFVRQLRFMMQIIHAAKRIKTGIGEEQMAHLRVFLMKNASQCNPTLQNNYWRKWGVTVLL